MKTMKNFAAQQLTKKQMNTIKGGEIAECYLFRNGETQMIYVLWDEYKKTEQQARSAGWELIC